MRNVLRSFLCLPAVAFTAACAGHSTVGSGRLSQGAATASSVVTAAELSKYATSSLADALRAVRPWLTNPRGSPPGVSIDGAMPGDLSTLNQVVTSEVAEVRLLRASQSAGARARILPNGDVALGDVLLVVTRTTK